MATKETIERLFKDYYSDLYSMAYSMLKDEEEAHDVVHEVFSNILHSQAHEEYGKGFLMRGVRNQCLNILKKIPIREKIRRRLIIESGEAPDEGEDIEEMIEEVRRIISAELPRQCSR
ncbi:MAG: hypothetical protein K2G69_01195, partial [Muribaculaceae bacterium]|nr:hypothetical protein [Muribaculaceae bacterium]